MRYSKEEIFDIIEQLENKKAKDLNAVVHREYPRAEAVFIKHYKDRIEVSNPGGFISGITPDNILRQNSRPRNRYLAEVLRKIGLIEKAGMGVKRMFHTQLASGKEIPAYIADEYTVRIIIKDGTLRGGY